MFFFSKAFFSFIFLGQIFKDDIAQNIKCLFTGNAKELVALIER